MRTLFVSLTLLSLAWPLAAADAPMAGPGMPHAMAPGQPPMQVPTIGAMADDADAEGEDGEDEGNEEDDSDSDEDSDEGMAEDDGAPPEPTWRMVSLVGPCDEQALRTVLTAMQEVDRSPAITDLWLVMDSTGGTPAASRAIANAFTLTTAKVHTVNLGRCAGEAVTVFAAATGRRYAYPNALFVVGRPAQPQVTAGVDESLARILSDHDARVGERILATRCQLPAGWLPLVPGTWRPLAPDAAVTARLVDAVVDRLPVGEEPGF